MNKTGFSYAFWSARKTKMYMVITAPVTKSMVTVNRICFTIGDAFEEIFVHVIPMRALDRQPNGTVL